MTAFAAPCVVTIMLAAPSGAALGWDTVAPKSGLGGGIGWGGGGFVQPSPHGSGCGCGVGSAGARPVASSRSLHAVCPRASPAAAAVVKMTTNEGASGDLRAEPRAIGFDFFFSSMGCLLATCDPARETRFFAVRT